MTPTPLIDAMAAHGKNSALKNVEVSHILTEGPLEIAKPEYEGKTLWKMELSIHEDLLFLWHAVYHAFYFRQAN